MLKRKQCHCKGSKLFVFRADPFPEGSKNNSDRVVTLESVLQYNLNGLNPGGSFTLDDSNFFFSPYKILPIAQENKYLGICFSYFIMELYVVCTH